MRYCHTCGCPNSDMLDPCVECGTAHDAKLPRCVPAHVPVAGYVSLAQLSQLTSQTPNKSCEAEPAEPIVKQPTDWFALSMGTVKWMGILVTCLVMAFFLTVILKAFM